MGIFIKGLRTPTRRYRGETSQAPAVVNIGISFYWDSLTYRHLNEARFIKSNQPHLWAHSLRCIWLVQLWLSPLVIRRGFSHEDWWMGSGEGAADQSFNHVEPCRRSGEAQTVRPSSRPLADSDPRRLFRSRGGGTCAWNQISVINQPVLIWVYVGGGRKCCDLDNRTQEAVYFSLVSVSFGNLLISLSTFWIT